jgi:hypothetical protein
MGIFAKRPEQDQAPISLPGEPLRPRSAAELLGTEAPVDAASLGSETISVSVPIALSAVEAGDAGDGD